ncbi:NAD-dependent epimerase/dehydratase family protein [Methylobacterium nodulans]|uniref:NAD-dependent epimerase/dehydratase n=1 Tax=Methylobacterium nodulans (strain LMG 21967 / CNCM I-2342 / ORS 2060) TaxID=460265 RepID=B8IWP4_METNO|nr:NAD-dependent epimerase/dehydratase family protein [Methylobacterium nodulans]ACL62935.1 NAD-dependent epimerase/dehydratase [Methylobacterium nodulans ORS 2060]
MTTLITGVSGFVGGALAAALVARSEDVIGVDRAPSPADPREGHGTYRFQAADLRQNGALDPILAEARVDRLIIGAAITADAARERSDPVGVITVNVAAVADAVRSAARHNVGRVLYLGSGAVYGDSAAGAGALVEDETPLRPRSLYAITKQAGEATALRLADTFGLDLVAARLGTCFGPYERDTGMRDTLSAPYQILRLAASGEPVRLPRPGRRDWLYIRDAVSGLLDAERLNHPVYNVAAGHEWPLTEWCAHVASAYSDFRWSVSGPETANVNLYDAFDRAPMSVARITADTTYRPAFDLAAVARDFLQEPFLQEPWSARQ